MRRIFTLIAVVLLFFISSSNSFSQCTGGTFTAGAIYNFTSSAQGFTGDFSASGGRLNSTTVSSGTTKLLTSTTLFQPASSNTVSWGFDLSGSANVTGYVVEAIYYASGSFHTVTICSAPGTSITPGTRNFAASAPAEIIGAQFQLKFTFTVSGGAGVNITVDNFRTTASFGNAPLPVTFSSLEANNVNNGVAVKWNIATEESVKGYNVEKSNDGKNFTPIGFVSASNSNAYSFTDYHSSSSAYYRIQSVDVDGKYSYSMVVFVKNNQSITVLKAFPVPAIKNLIVQHGTADAGSLITIAGEDGRIIKRVVPMPGAQQTEIDLSNTQPGLYLMSYINNNETSTLKIVKQ
jgi:hypothetical protein